MSFSRAHRRVRGAEPQRRDRHGIVGLSGWLFADLLLGIAIVFLVIQDKPGAGPVVPVGNDRARPTPTIKVDTDSLEGGSWIDARGEALRVEVTFDEPVNLQAGSGDELSGFVRLGGTASGLSPWAIEPFGEFTKSFVLRLEQRGPVTRGTIEIQLLEGIARDRVGLLSTESNTIEVAIQTSAISIDPSKPVQLQIPLPRTSCEQGVEDPNTTQAVGGATGFTVGRKGLGVGERVEGQKLSDWVNTQLRGAKFGFAILTGGGEQGNENAFRVQKCIEEAFRKLGWLSDQKFVARFYNEPRLSSSRLKVDIYFLTSGTTFPALP